MKRYRNVEVEVKPESDNPAAAGNAE